MESTEATIDNSNRLPADKYSSKVSNMFRIVNGKKVLTHRQSKTEIVAYNSLKNFMPNYMRSKLRRMY